MPKSLSPLEHYREDVAECSCGVCSPWRAVKAEFDAARLGWIGHEQECDCAACRHFYAVRSAYIVASNRRDVYCEMSYHSAHNIWGGQCMGWLPKEIARHDSMGRHWWESIAPTLPMEYWLLGFFRAFSGMVSGGVRRVGT